MTYIAGWDKGIKYLADAGLLEGVVLIAIGSDMADAFSRPQRASRGGRFSPPSPELCRGCGSKALAEQPRAATSSLPEETEQVLLEEFLVYLVRGGFLTAINDMARHDRILPATFATYSFYMGKRAGPANGIH